jgi:hypothetical protein
VDACSQGGKVCKSLCGTNQIVEATLDFDIVFMSPAYNKLFTLNCEGLCCIIAGRNSCVAINASDGFFIIHW